MYDHTIIDAWQRRCVQGGGGVVWWCIRVQGWWWCIRFQGWLCGAVHGIWFDCMVMYADSGVALFWCVRRTTGCGARSTSLLVYRYLLWQLSRGRNLHGSGISHALQPLPNHDSGRLQRVGDAMVGRGWTCLPMPELLTRASCKKDRKWISAESCLMPTPHLLPQTTNWSRD